MSKPDWNVVIKDGKPEVVINLAAAATLVHQSPLGVKEAVRRIKATLPARLHDQLDEAVRTAA